MNRFVLVIGFITLGLAAFSQQLQSPDTFFGYPLGTYFSRHHQVVDYFRQLEKNAPEMVKVEKYGQTNENRELIVSYISSPENLKRLAEIKDNHAKGTNETVAIVWMSYNVHGNESAGTEASMLTAYELITAKKDWLKNVVVIIDPCINPDGRDRYVNWYNQQKNSNYDVNVKSAEHDEPWPSGRPNHYLFDLNRDWAWATQVETQQRLIVYNQWLPHVHVDFHEQGMNDPYYFAPAAEPFHEVITNWQREFQNGLGRNHAKHFDQNGWFYFTREIFDLLYPSYGDTYPTFNGAIGMTYEQGGSGRGGLGVINAEGDTLTLIDRMIHHHASGMSTVEYSALQATKLIDEYKKFVSSKNYKYKSYVVGGNPEKVAILKSLLDKHQVEYSYGNGASVKGFDYSTGKSGSMNASDQHLIIQTNQKRGTLVNVLFEPRTKLADSMTYDITAWSLPYAYGLNAIASETVIKGTSTQKPIEQKIAGNDTYAYLVRWESMSDARFLSELLQKGIKVRYNELVFTFGQESYNPGTLIIVKGENKIPNIDQLIQETTKKYQLTYTTTTTGMVDTGKDFGSSSVKLIEHKKIALLSGAYAESLNAGEVWHFFNNELNYPISLLNSESFSPDQLNGFDILIIPEGYYGGVIGNAKDALDEWINKGGKIIAIGSALSAFNSDNGFALKAKATNTADTTSNENRHEHAHITYDAQEREAIKNTITGAIFKCKVENTNPLAFGYGDTYFSLKLSANSYDLLPNGNNVVYIDKDSVPIAGFAGCNTLANLPKTLVFGQENRGNGCIIYMVDNPLFRGFWENGKLLFVNALFYANN
jgi:hypothetical protein